MQDYRRLVVWQKSHRLALATFADIATYLRQPEAWALAEQMRRAAISIPSNIAEGTGRGTDADFHRFLYHSLGSTNELEYDLLLARDLNFLPNSVHDERGSQLEEVRRLLSGLIGCLAV